MAEATWENCDNHFYDIVRSAQNLADNDIFEQLMWSDVDEYYTVRLQKQLESDIMQYRVYKVSGDLGQSLRKIDEVVCEYERGNYLWLRQNNESQDFMEDGVIQRAVFFEGRF